MNAVTGGLTAAILTAVAWRIRVLWRRAGRLTDALTCNQCQWEPGRLASPCQRHQETYR